MEEYFGIQNPNDSFVYFDLRSILTPEQNKILDNIKKRAKELEAEMAKLN